jgi:hypothetical protein
MKENEQGRTRIRAEVRGRCTDVSEVENGVKCRKLKMDHESTILPSVS